MKKYFALLGILLLVSVSFAGRLPQLNNAQWGAYKMACCDYLRSYYLIDTAWYNYMVYYEGEGCGYPELKYEYYALLDAWCGYEEIYGVLPAFQDMLEACDGAPQSPDCLTATRYFYSEAGRARQTFRGGMGVYYGVARQAVRDHYLYDEACDTTVGQVRSDMMENFFGYLECMHAPNEEIYGVCSFREECMDGPE